MRQYQVYLFIVLAIVALCATGCTKGDKTINNISATDNPNSIINNPNIDIIGFVPDNVNNIVFDHVWLLDNPGQGYMQRGFLFFNVTGEATSIIQEGAMKYTVSPHTIDPSIMLNIYVCDENNITSCQNNLIISPKNDSDLINRDIVISNRNISYFEAQKKEGLTERNGILTDTDVTSYIWCDHKYCFQMISHYQFENITTTLIQKIIERYSR
jgi:hypothetical protein